MKITIFYSWQSDLPNNKNRGLILEVIDKAKKIILETNKHITEIEIISDSRSENGTPDLVSSIFNKIDEADIFIADISIINSTSKGRVTPNPNVLIELGYAARTLGWNKLLCFFNKEYSPIESLPFDIRSRKPIVYDTTSISLETKKVLAKCLAANINSIVDNVLIDKYEYTISKQKVDLAMQAVLFDFCKLLFSDKDRYNYNKILMMTYDDLYEMLKNKELLGFYLFRNISADIKEFTEYFNDKLETYFLSDEERRILAKLVFSLKSYEKLLHDSSFWTIKGKKTDLVAINAKDINSNNPNDSYILMKQLEDNKSVVLSSGKFLSETKEQLLNIYQISDKGTLMASCIMKIVENINEWICLSGKYFIVNTKGLID